MNTRHLRPEDLRGLRWRGYVRESTEAQADRWSPERQRADLRRAADDLGMVPAEPTWYERTGTGESRSEELDQALADVGQYDVLLVLTTSRFARNRAEAVRRKAEFGRAGIPIYFVQDRILSGTRHTRLLEGVREVIDEEENEQRRFFIAGGLRERQFSGRWIGRLPFGFRRALVEFPDGRRGWDGALEPDPTTAPDVRWMFEQATTGTPPRAIALTLNLRGMRTTQGAPWSARTVIRLLRNPVYVGQLVRYRMSHSSHYYPEGDDHDGRREVGQAFPSLVDEALFRAVGEVLGERHHPTTKRFAYPLSGSLRCANCGYKMTGGYSRAGRYYRCAGRIVYAVCTARFARADRVEAQFADWLAGYTLPPDWRTEIARSVVRTVRSDEASRQTRLAERLTRLRNLYAWGELDEPTYRAQAAELHGEMAVMAKPTMASLTAVADALQTLGPAWRSAAPETQATVARLMLESAEVKDGRVSTWLVRAALRPLLDLCVVDDRSSLATAVRYIA
jgi:DNA invertase Pin-like site-specific DNA recombinase